MATDEFSFTAAGGAPAALDRVHKSYQNSPQRSKNGSTLPHRSTDWVLVANILHQSDPQKILSEASRIVADAGAVLAIEWDTVATPLGPPAEQRIAKQQVEEIAKATGLTSDTAFAPSPYHYGFIFKLGTA